MVMEKLEGGELFERLVESKSQTGLSDHGLFRVQMDHFPSQKKAGYHLCFLLVSSLPISKKRALFNEHLWDSDFSKDMSKELLIMIASVLF